jgi:hypothetical protein
MIKKILKISGIIFVVVLALLIALPFIFKDDIINKIKEEANNNLNAKVDFGDFDLSIISTFPDFHFSINDVKVSGIDKFEGIDLAKIKQLNLSLDLMSVINGDNYKIKSIEIIEPQIKAIVLADSTANWDIAKESEDEAADDTSEESTPFKMELKNFTLTNGDIYYEDATMDLSTDIKRLNFTMSGDMSQDVTTLNTYSTIDTFTVIMENIPYLNKTKIEAKADIEADLANSKYTFKDNEFKVNELVLGLNGWLALIDGTPENPDGEMDMDLTFDAKQTDFKTILSLVPAVYMTDFSDVKTQGQIALNGYAKGKYTETALPGFGLDLLVKNAMFKYPDLPKSVNNIAIDLHIDNPGGSEDNTNIDLNKFHMEIAGNPIDASMKIRKPVSDPDIQAQLKAKLDLASVKDVLPMEEGEDYNGKIASDVSLKGKISALENEKYDEFDAHGTFSIKEMNYKSADLPYEVWLNELTLNFNPQKVALQNFDSKIGKTDIQANGDIENFIQYAFADDQVLKGKFNVTSNYMDLNEFMEEDSTITETPADSEEEPLEVIEVPANIDFALNANFKKVHYDNMDIDNVKGNLLVKEQKVSMNDVAMDMLGGSMLMNGYYETTNPKEPGISFGMKIKNFDVEQVVSTFNTIEKLAPVAKACKGKFNVDMSMDGLLDDKLEPKLESLNGLGDMLTQNLQVIDFKPMVKLSSALQNDKFKKIDIGNSQIKFSFKDGKVNVEPFKLKVGNYQGKMWGYNALDQTLEYTMEVGIPLKDIGGDALNEVKPILEQIKAAGIKIDENKPLPLQIKLAGEVMNPKIKTNLKELVKGMAGNLKDQIKETIKEEVNEQIDKAKEEAIAKAKEEAAKIIAEAEKQAQKIRDEAAKTAAQVKSEGYKQAQQLEDEAKNPIAKVAAKKAADKLRQETDKKAQQIIDEGNKKADALVNSAKEKADKIIKEAENK